MTDLPSEEEVYAYAALLKMECELQVLSDQKKSLDHRFEWLRSQVEAHAKALNIEAMTPEKKMSLKQSLAIEMRRSRKGSRA